MKNPHRNNDDTFTSNARSHFSRTFERDLRAHYGSLGLSYFRVAQFAIVVHYDDIIARVEYDDDGFNENFDIKWVQYREGMLTRVELNLRKTHPYYEEIVKAIAREREFYRNAR